MNIQIYVYPPVQMAIQQDHITFAEYVARGVINVLSVWSEVTRINASKNVFQAQ